ncbi:hypothetical protein ACJZ2D_008221 [Fusarium nematophilum]
MEALPAEILANICSFLAIGDEDDTKIDCDCAEFQDSDDDDSDASSNDGSIEHQEDCNDHQAYQSVIQAFEKRRPAAGTRPTADVRNFRLVSKRFSSIAAAFTHEWIPFRLQDADLSTLEAVASTAHLARSVRGLRYYATDLTARGRLSEDAYYGYWPAGTDSPDSAVSIAKPSDTPSAEHHPYATYCALYDQQEHLREDGRDEAFFRTLFPRLEHLQDVELVCGKRLRGWQEVRTVLAAAADTGVNLRSLKVGALHWRFLTLGEKRLGQLLLRPLQRVRQLELVMDTEDFALDDSDVVVAQSKNGVLSKMLEPLVELRSLTVHLPPFSQATMPPRLHDIMPTGKLPHLRRLSIRGFTADPDDLLSLLRLHGDTLRDLCMGEAWLLSSTWEAVTGDLREELDLDRACLCGDLYQVVGPEGRREVPPGAVWYHHLAIDEDYVHADEQGARWRMVVALDNYCCGRDGVDECPLSDESMIWRHHMPS